MSSAVNYMRAINTGTAIGAPSAFLSVKVETVMLRISYSQTEPGQQWTLCGQLAGPWVQELRSFWQYTRLTGAESRAVVDLSDVTFIDEHGERLLSEMRNAGVEFVAAGVETIDLIDNLKDKGERPLRRLVGRLTDVANPCGKPRLAENIIRARGKRD
jgi:hypothetical protein